MGSGCVLPMTKGTYPAGGWSFTAPLPRGPQGHSCPGQRLPKPGGLVCIGAKWLSQWCGTSYKVFLEYSGILAPSGDALLRNIFLSFSFYPLDDFMSILIGNRKGVPGRALTSPPQPLSSSWVPLSHVVLKHSVFVNLRLPHSAPCVLLMTFFAGLCTQPFLYKRCSFEMPPI